MGDVGGHGDNGGHRDPHPTLATCPHRLRPQPLAPPPLPTAPFPLPCPSLAPPLSASHAHPVYSHAYYSKPRPSLHLSPASRRPLSLKAAPGGSGSAAHWAKSRTPRCLPPPRSAPPIALPTDRPPPPRSAPPLRQWDPTGRRAPFKSRRKRLPALREGRKKSGGSPASSFRERACALRRFRSLARRLMGFVVPLGAAIFEKQWGAAG